MKAYLTDNIEVEIIVNANLLPYSPRWMLDFREVALYPGWLNTEDYCLNFDAYMAHIQSTIGYNNTDWDTINCMRFDKESHLLESFWSDGSFRDTEAPEDFSFWLDVPVQAGNLRLINFADFHVLLGCMWRTDTECKSMIYLTYESEDNWMGDQSRLRLQIANDFDLLFTNNKFCGYILHQPHLYITRRWQQLSPVQKPAKLADQFKRFITLCSQASLKRMRGKDPEALAQLTALDEELRAENLTQTISLQEEIKSLIEDYYRAGG